MKVNERAGRILLRIRGEYDCLRGIPPKKKQPDYLAGYGRQYEIEQRESHNAKPF